MTDPLQIAKMAKGLGIQKIVPTVYQDLLQPPTKVFGKQLEVIAKSFNIILGPLKMVNWGYEQFEEFLSKDVSPKLSKKRPENIVPPPLPLVGQLLLNVPFATEEPHLRELYAKLLARAMHKPEMKKAHPSFVSVIQQLSPSESKILEVIARHYTARKVLFTEVNSQIALKGKRRETMCEQWRKFCLKAVKNCDKTLADAFYYNFIRLGLLIERTETTDIDGAFAYDGSDLSPRTETSLVLTEYGDLFLEVCVREIK